MRLTRLFFAMNALAVLVSVALTALAGLLFLAIYTSVFGREAHADDLRRMVEVRSGMGELLREAQALKFEQLLDKTYREELAARVRAMGAHAVILKNREVLFSTVTLSPIDVEKSLLLSDGVPDTDTLEIGGKNYMFARADYRLNSGDEGVLLLLAPIRLKWGFYLVFGAVIAGFFIVSFLLMNLWVTHRFWRGVIAPVSRLKSAAAKISEGDLSRGIAEEGEGEVRELCRALELMRIKLKESVHLQQKYDENRKFLVSSISHDLKTPVTAIIGYIDGIIDGVAQSPEKTGQYLETARSKAMLVNAMIDDLLLYSKLDLNQIPFHFEPTDWRQYFEDCCFDFRHEFEQARIQLSLVSELKEPVIVSIDRERMKRVVQNILDNARKYMGRADGRVDIILRETRTSAIVEIRDNGRGIPESDLPHIFDRFFRADPSRKSADGSGLGLAIARQIVEGHEGKIWALSAVGEGTRIMISLRKCQ
jgi:signal transduction histidine kinase